MRVGGGGCLLLNSSLFTLKFDLDWHFVNMPNFWDYIGGTEQSKKNKKELSTSEINTDTFTNIFTDLS